MNSAVQIAPLFVFALFVGLQIPAHKLFLTVLEAGKCKVKTQDLHAASLYAGRNEMKKDGCFYHMAVGRRAKRS